MAFQVEGAAVVYAAAAALLVVWGLLAAMCFSRRPDPKMKFLTELLDRNLEKESDE